MKVQTKKSNNKNPRSKQIITMYTKRIHTADLENEIEIMAAIHPVIGVCLGCKDITTIDGIRNEMVKSFMENQPDIAAGENMFWQIEASSSKCILKTSSHISFGYKFKYKKNTEAGDKFVIDDSGIEFVIVLFKEDDNIEKALEAAGYKKESDK